MKKINLLLLIFLFSCSQGAAEEFQTGEEVYEARCSSCHGANLEGRVGPSIDSNSASASMPDAYWVQTITKGKGSMPAVRLSETEVQLVIEYIKSKY
tara:strand:+ start:1062 stop:1352 length:291 start_codon:yes stop_codon:yes gene_type:complete